MTTSDEELIDKLDKEFPDVSRRHIATVLAAEQLRLQGSPVPAFVPLLVERATIRRLRRGTPPTITCTRIKGGS